MPLKKKFQSLKGMKKDCGLMSDKGLKKMVKKFEDTGPFKGKSGRERKSIASTSVEVATTLHKGTKSGTHMCST